MGEYFSRSFGVFGFARGTHCSGETQTGNAILVTNCLEAKVI